MTKRRIDLDEALKNPDLALISDYLANELDPERVAEVRRRLEEDPAFRDFAAPIVAMWNVTPAWKREPIAHAEVERSWAKFTKRAGFRGPRRSRWKMWLMIVAFIILAPFFAVIAFSTYVASDLYFATKRSEKVGFVADFPVVDSTRITTLPNGMKVALDSGAALRMARRDSTAFFTVVLTGKATFLVDPDTLASPAIAQGLAVETQGGRVMIGIATAEVDARGDTTDVRVFGLPQDPRPWARRLVMVTLLAAEPSSLRNLQLMLVQGERGRMVRGIGTSKLPAIYSVREMPEP
jgi:hypothetical protein